MDLTPYFGGIVSAAVFFIGSYVAMKSANERRFNRIETRMAAQDEKLEQALEDAHIGHELSIQLAELATKMDNLAKSVEKHNSVVERVAVVERDMHTLWKRHDEIKGEIAEMRRSLRA